MKRAYETIIRMVSVISVILLIALGPILAFTYSRAFWDSQLAKDGAYDALGKEHSSELSSNVIGFLQGRNSLSEEFTPDERSHMLDVRRLYAAANILVALGLLVLLSLIIIRIFFYDKMFKMVSRQVFIASSSIFALGIIFLVIILIDFRGFFLAFHHVFFPQGNFLFPADSLLITLMPESFFVSVCTCIFVSIMALSLATASISYRLSRRNEKKIFKRHRQYNR